MTKWVWKGLHTGVKTTCYPGKKDRAPGISPGFPAGKLFSSAEQAQAAAESCPTDALYSVKEELVVREDRCIHCMKCKASGSGGVDWKGDYEWARFGNEGHRLPAGFSHSLHIRILDAGGCDACMSEIRQITSPYYNIHKLGFFITPTPRAADILLVAGPLTEHMIDPLLKTYEAMPQPKKVIGIGACALSGGIFGKNFAVMGGIEEVLPIDIKIPGCPPPPLAIVHGLLLAAGRVGEVSQKGGSVG